MGETLKLSILCMKTGFTQYLDKSDDHQIAPTSCHPTSYLYQYATLQFAAGTRVGNCESINCNVLDALDETDILPPKAEDRAHVHLAQAQNGRSKSIAGTVFMSGSPKPWPDVPLHFFQY